VCVYRCVCLCARARMKIYPLAWEDVRKRAVCVLKVPAAGPIWRARNNEHDRAHEREGERGKGGERENRE